MREYVKYTRKGVVRFRKMGREVKTGYTLAEVKAWPGPLAQLVMATLKHRSAKLADRILNNNALLQNLKVTPL